MSTERTGPAGRPADRPEALRDWIAEIERVLAARRWRPWSARDQLMRLELLRELHDARGRLEDGARG